MPRLATKESGAGSGCAQSPSSRVVRVGFRDKIGPRPRLPLGSDP
ncbi:hypothetical protein AKJ09_02551 [Labilithrix luteola]|uniref:Uncharacterized protein n=1 Tax=Labilithrix luteola TaxID=1391654 RepID=A0A0K1PQT3_9BACT|nr:hypothetical protein AKJ09_02551 [Labilithrix luteola]